MLAKGGAVAEWYGPYEGSAETKGGVSSEGSGLYGRGGPVSAEFCVGVFVSGLVAVVMGNKRGELKGSIGNEKLDVLSGSMDKKGVAIVREGTATRVNLDESGATCDGSPKVISSPLVSPTATLIMPPRGPYEIDVAATF
ncbi:hypothetical protein Tco_0116469 [Tanacetum coccineum]